MVAIGLGQDPLDDVRDGEANAGNDPLKWQHYNPAKHGDDSGRANMSQQEPDVNLRDRKNESLTPDQIRAAEKRGNYYNPDNSYADHLERFNKKHKFWTKNKKRAAIASILTGGAGLTIFGFSLLTPLKIDAFMSRLQGLFGASGDFASNTITENLLDRYYIRYVLPGVKAGRCHSTISKGCVGLVSGDSPVDATYKAWSQEYLENKMGKYFEIGEKNGQYYMKLTVGETTSTGTIPTTDFREMLDGKITIFDEGSKIGLAGKGNQAEVRAAIRQALKDTTLWDRIKFRLLFGKLLEEKYGIRRCIIACNVKDKFNDSITTKKLAAKAYFAEKVIQPISDEYAFALECVIGGGDLCDTTNLKSADDLKSVDPEKLTDYQKGLQSRLLEYAAEEGTDLAHVAELTSEISEKGFANAVIEKALASVFGEETAKLGTKAIPIVGWVLLAAQIISIADKVGPTIRIMSYATTAAAAVHLYMMYRTVDSEMKSGHVDPTELGSFTQALSTNMSGSSTDQVDMTDTPLYGALFGGNTDPSKSKYRCNDGSQIPEGQLVCPEEKLDRGSGVTDAISSIANIVPGLTALAHIVDVVNAGVGWLTGHTFDLACNTLFNIPPGGFASCPKTVQRAGAYVTQFSNWFINQLVPSPFTNDMSGGRTGDMLAAGADVAYNKDCQVNYGCAKLTNQQVADIRNQMLSDQKTSFEGQPMLARLFSTSSPYSLISQLAVSMPGSLTIAANDLATTISAPVSTVSSMLTNVFAGSRVFAAQQPIDDPFGVVQYGYTADQIPSDPETYWNVHCQGDFRTQFFNGATEDTNTGEALNATPEPCLLIQSMSQATGTLFNPALAPADTLNP